MQTHIHRQHQIAALSSVFKDADVFNDAIEAILFGKARGGAGGQIAVETAFYAVNALTLTV